LSTALASQTFSPKLPLMPTECTVRRTGAAVTHEHRRWNAWGTQAAGAGRV